MKKYICASILSLILALPVHAQTLDVQSQLVLTLQQTISLLQQEVQLLLQQLSLLQAQSPNFSSIQPTQQTNQVTQFNQSTTTMDTTPSNAPTCTLTPESSTRPAGSFVTLTWTTTNAVSGYLDTNRIVLTPQQQNAAKLIPIEGGTVDFPVSSEAGEVNIITAHVTGTNGSTTTCSVQVTTN